MNIDKSYEKATKKQVFLMSKYRAKYGSDYLLSYLHQFYPEATWDTLSKSEAQRIITGRKLHERYYKLLLKEKSIEIS